MDLHESSPDLPLLTAYKNQCDKVVANKIMGKFKEKHMAKLEEIKARVSRIIEQ